MKIVAIIQARMGSTRLPGKIMKKIKDKEILGYVISRVKKSKQIDQVVVATTDKQKDDIIVNYCKNNSTDCFRGSEDDVLDRYYQCAKKYNADIIVRITSDCPLIDWKIADKCINYFIDYITRVGEYDYLVNTWFPNSYPSGFDIQITTFKMLEEYWNFEKNIKIREHSFSGMLKYPEKYKGIQFTDLQDNHLIKNHLSVDTRDDFELIKKIIKYHIENNKEDFEYKDIMKYIELNKL